MKQLIKAYSLEDVLYRWEEKEDKEELRFVLLNAMVDESLKITDPIIDMTIFDIEQDIKNFLQENKEYGICYFPSGRDFIFKRAFWQTIWGFVDYGYAFKGSPVQIQTVLENLCVKKQDFLDWLKKTDQSLPDFWFSSKERMENQTTESRRKGKAMTEALNDPKEQQRMLGLLEAINAIKGVPRLLHDWFKHDTWKKDEGLMLLSGLSPETLFGFDENIYGEPLRITRYLETLDGLEGAPGGGSNYERRLASYERLWESGNHASKATPQYFIDWALSKGEPPTWLDFAVEKGYYSTKKEALTTDLNMELSGKSKKTALELIGGLVMSTYGIDIHAERLKRLSEVVADLNRVGITISAEIVSKWIKEAAQVIEKPKQ